MALVDEVSKVLAEFRPDPEQRLESLQNFLEKMKAAGVAKIRQYDLPRPDTIGRSPGGAGPRNDALAQIERRNLVQLPPRA